MDVNHEFLVYFLDKLFEPERALSENASTEILNQQQPFATANNCQVHPESSSFLLYGSNNIIKKKILSFVLPPPSIHAHIL